MIVLLVLLLGFVGMGVTEEMGIHLSSTDIHLAQSYIEHEDILIESNTDFATQGWLGSGTESNPYIIEWLNITGHGGYGIRIYTTDVYCIIRHCIIQTFYGGTATGIHLAYAKNVEIDDCDIHVDGYGATFAWSQYCSIRDSRIKWASKGINSIDSSNCIAEDNIIWEMDQIGINLWLCDRWTVQNNTIYDAFHQQGIYCRESERMEIDGNTIWNAKHEGIFIESSDSVTVTENTVHHVGPSTASSDTGHGIRALDSEGIQILDNSIYNNSGNGILAESDLATIEGNLIHNNEGHGVMIDGASRVEVKNNDIFWNEKYGVYMTNAALCDIYGNRVAKNRQGEAYDDQTQEGLWNAWDDRISTGNSWGDYSGTGTYLIDGPAGAVDNYPEQQVSTPTQLTSTQPTPTEGNEFDFGVISIVVTVASVGCIALFLILILRFRIRSSNV